MGHNKSGAPQFVMPVNFDHSSESLRNCCCQYAVLMFFGAGAQITMCLLFYGGAITVSGTTVKLVRCCLAQLSGNCVVNIL